MAGIYRKYRPITRDQFDKREFTREELIKSYIPLVLSIAKRFPAKFIEQDEAKGIGLYELTRCINNCIIINQAQLTKYVKRSVFNRIKDHCIKYYGRSIIRTKGRNCKPVKTISGYTDNFSYKHYFKLDLEDTINAIVCNSIERVIINRVMEGGYTLEDIAKETGISISYVSILRTKILEELSCELVK